MSDRKVWLKSGEYLPDFMRDFHDQKDLFKSLHAQYRLDEPKDHRDPINWIQAHIYTVDKFLWFMAEHGYTLQRSRKHVSFCDISATLAHHEKLRMEAFGQALGLTPISDPPPPQPGDSTP
jgi:hypothetical protein